MQIKMKKPMINSQTQTAGDNANQYQAGGDLTITNLYRSVDYQALQTELEKARERVKKYPDDLDLSQELQETEKN